MTRLEAIQFAKERIVSIDLAIKSWNTEQKHKQYGEYADGIVMEASIQRDYWVELKEALERE